MSGHEHKPNWRQPAGMMLILLIIAIWVTLMANLSDHVWDWPFALQMLFFLIAGTMWVLPLKPVLQWMETGSWRKPPQE